MIRVMRFAIRQFALWKLRLMARSIFILENIRRLRTLIIVLLARSLTNLTLAIYIFMALPLRLIVFDRMNRSLRRKIPTFVTCRMIYKWFLPSARMVTSLRHLTTLVTMLAFPVVMT